tara:strand:+ start:1103 stop:1738 length:636 start_codon:yes stop_codon:yes gene_type:complete
MDNSITHSEIINTEQEYHINITHQDLVNLISDVDYINNCVSNKERHETSISYLITRELSQSECIKLGNAIEKYITKCIEKFTCLINIRKPNKKGKREKDIIFIDRENKILYYSEIKTNINLDTEKCKSTYEKCIKITKELEDGNYEIKWCLLAARYKHYDDIPNNYKKKYNSIKNNLFGINQFFEMFGVNYVFTDENYKSLLNTIADSCFN